MLELHGRNKKFFFGQRTISPRLYRVPPAPVPGAVSRSCHRAWIPQPSRRIAYEQTHTTFPRSTAANRRRAWRYIDRRRRRPRYDRHWGIGPFQTAAGRYLAGLSYHYGAWHLRCRADRRLSQGTRSCAGWRRTCLRADTCNTEFICALGLVPNAAGPCRYADRACSRQRFLCTTAGAGPNRRLFSAAK